MHLSNINLYHLKYFQDVVRFRSFSKAAEANFVSRPAISKAMLRLEKNLGYELFEHQKKVVQLTSKGQKFTYSLEPILKQLDSAIMNQLSYEHLLKIGVSYSIFNSLIQSQLTSFLQSDESNKFDIQFGPSRQLIGLLSSKEIDFAILLDHQASKAFESHRVHSGRFILVSPKGRQKYKTLITTEDRPETLLINHLYGDRYSRHLKVASWSACTDLITANVGVGLIPDFLYDKQSMKKLSLKENIPYTVWAVWRPETDPHVFMEMLNKKE